MPCVRFWPTSQMARHAYQSGDRRIEASLGRTRTSIASDWRIARPKLSPQEYCGRRWRAPDKLHRHGGAIGRCTNTGLMVTHMSSWRTKMPPRFYLWLDREERLDLEWARSGHCTSTWSSAPNFKGETLDGFLNCVSKSRPGEGSLPIPLKQTKATKRVCCRSGIAQHLEPHLTSNA